MAFVSGLVRWLAASAAGLLVLAGVARNGCDEQASCTSFMGNPTPDWPFVVPALIAIAATAMAYALLGALAWFWRTYSAERDALS